MVPLSSLCHLLGIFVGSLGESHVWGVGAVLVQNSVWLSVFVCGGGAWGGRGAMSSGCVSLLIAAQVDACLFTHMHTVQSIAL